MLAELELLLEATSAGAVTRDYRIASAGENAVEKHTLVNREHTTRKLKALYGLDPAMPVFRALRTFWSIDPQARPLLALLCALARDPLFRLISDAVLDLRVGQEIEPARLEELVRERAPGRFSGASERSIARNVLSSWTQSGHLVGHQRKMRCRAPATIVATAYAMLLGYLEGIRAQRLLGTLWARTLDRTSDDLVALVSGAGQRGLLSFRQVSSIMEIRFGDLLTREEEEWARESS